MKTVTKSEADNGRGEWLEWRRRGFGASDSPALLKLSPFPDATPHNIFKSKREGGEEGEEREESEAQEYGNLMEPILQAYYERRTGRKVVATQVRVEHPKYPFIMATLDGVDSLGYVVEFKCSDVSGWGEAGTEEVPKYYWAQVQHQLLAADKEHAHLCNLKGKRFRMYPIERDEAYTEALKNFLIECKAALDSGNNPPPPPVTLYPGKAEKKKEDKGVIELSGEFAEKASKLISLRETIRDLTSMEKSLGDTLKRKLEGASLGMLPDGRRLRVRETEYEEKMIYQKARKQVSLEVVKDDRKQTPH
jgi:putative phage-type endonuclease